MLKMDEIDKWLKSKLPVDESDESEGDETKVPEEVEESVPSRSLVLESNQFPQVLCKILSYLDFRSVKRASLVSR